MANKCLYCSYAGEEKVCPKCGMLMQEQCSVCKETMGGCICSKKSKKVEK